MSRYIDADEFLENNKEFADREIEHPRYQATVRELIDEAPSIDIEPKRGEWLIEKTLYDNYNYRCSYCDWYECHAYPDVEPYNFCPNCGADMRGADDE